MRFLRYAKHSEIVTRGRAARIIRIRMPARARALRAKIPRRRLATKMARRDHLARRDRPATKGCAGTPRRLRNAPLLDRIARTASARDVSSLRLLRRQTEWRAIL